MPKCALCDPTTELVTHCEASTSQPDKILRHRAGAGGTDETSDGGLESTAATPRPYHAPGVNPSSSLTSQMETSSALTCSSLPSSIAGPGIGAYTGTAAPGGSSLAETCRNCGISLPGTLGERIHNSNPERVADRSPKTLPPVLRTRETIPAHGPGDIRHFGPGWQDGGVKDLQDDHIHIQQISQNDHSNHIPGELKGPPKPCFGNIPPGSSVSSSLNSEDEDDFGNIESIPVSSLRIPTKYYDVGPHSHSITYLSQRVPSTPSRFSMLRQSCIRSLSCELIPTQTGPIFFGDSLTGYTIAYVFRIADPKARGGKRSYALLCICPEEKMVVRSWNYVVGTFENLVQRIKGFAALKNAKDKLAAQRANIGTATTSAVSSGITNPEGFLRRSHGLGSAKGLAELVGKEDLFVEIHVCFAELLGVLAKRYGLLLGTMSTEVRETNVEVGRTSADLCVNGSNLTRSKSMAMQDGIDRGSLFGDGTSSMGHRRLSTGTTGFAPSPRGVAAG